jgi:hypothetical protein
LKQVLVGWHGAGEQVVSCFRLRRDVPYFVETVLDSCEDV